MREDGPLLEKRGPGGFLKQGMPMDCLFLKACSMNLLSEAGSVLGMSPFAWFFLGTWYYDEIKIQREIVANWIQPALVRCLVVWIIFSDVGINTI